MNYMDGLVSSPTHGVFVNYIEFLSTAPHPECVYNRRNEDGFSAVFNNAYVVTHAVDVFFHFKIKCKTFAFHSSTILYKLYGFERNVVWQRNQFSRSNLCLWV